MASARPVRRVHRRETLHLSGEALRIVAVADTHSRPHPAARARLEALAPHHILHAGDIGDLAVLDGLARSVPLSAVRGNIDTRAHGLPDTMTLDIRDGDAPLLTILLLHIAVYGPKLRADAAQLARAEGASLVVCGHSHVPFIGRDRGVTVFNPGSIGPRRFHLPIVFGVIDISRSRVDLRHVDCETGETWMPAA
ncbi:MAG TPA: metallophosphoesterase family protein [Polyangiaceae bacterium]|nr:metallophosphoesterase family protein [Polyangiaceae bacterium]